MDFKVGDVVKLKSGVPNMTVLGSAESLHGGPPLVKCCWSDNGDTKTGSFPPDILEKAPDESLTLADEVFKKLCTKE
ncbi:MAG: YodC family protein [Spirochaetaceae bacterium]|jgi:uncharacterized protein YodC (DUF2158 family)|nr:YodC family protein [Spirochaetaceae bacterium]